MHFDLILSSSFDFICYFFALTLEHFILPLCRWKCSRSHFIIRANILRHLIQHSQKNTVFFFSPDLFAPTIRLWLKCLPSKYLHFMPLNIISISAPLSSHTVNIFLITYYRNVRCLVEILFSSAFYFWLVFRHCAVCTDWMEIKWNRLRKHLN